MQFIRFLIVGGIATGVQYAVLIALVQGRLADPVVASSIGFALSMLLNYALNRWMTFRSTRSHAAALPRFLLVASVGFVINGVIVWLIHDQLGQMYLVAQVIATGSTLVWNFAANRTWTFNEASA